jgi:hypothetical protein
MITITEAQEMAAHRVRAGAFALDRIKPGWARLINLAELDIFDLNQCVIGQIWGNYADYADDVARLIDPKIVGDAAWEAEMRPTLTLHGFIVAPPVTGDMLLVQWRQEVRERL